MGTKRVMSVNSLLEVQHLHFHYRKKLILHDISFALRRGEVVAIIGPSGAGKSTLLKALVMLIQPSQGEIVFRDRTVFSSNAIIQKKDLLNYRRSVGMVFQELHLWPHLTAIENILLPLIRGKGMKKEQARAKAEDILRKLSIEEFANQYPSKLSVGQKQRCAIARTLAMDLEIILLDEITSALDPELVYSILELIKDIATDPDRTLLIVTHEMEFAKKVSHRIGFIDAGKLIALGTPLELCEPDVDPRVSRYLG